LIVTYRDVLRVTFPVFKLPSDNLEFTDGLLTLGGKIVDDKNMEGKTLGARRLQTYMKPLHPLRLAVLDLTGIIKQRERYFIDSKGIPFIYEKTRSCKLSYYRIKKVERKETASLLWLHGVRAPIKIPRPPFTEYRWAGILHLNKFPWLLYEFSEVKLKDSNRKV